MDPISDIFRTVPPVGKRLPPADLAHFAMLSRGNCWLSVERIPEPIPLTGGDCFLVAKGTFDCSVRQPANTS
ncbi:hypothetical protein HDF11_005305 [Tunturiibacter psychrotolerans]